MLDLGFQVLVMGVHSMCVISRFGANEPGLTYFHGALALVIAGKGAPQTFEEAQHAMVN